MKLPTLASEQQRISDQLVQCICAEIQQTGPMPFSRYMEMALYQSGLGYYSAGARKFGAGGDFVTAPELGCAFATLMAARFAQVLQGLENPTIVELGAGSGVFAHDCIEALRSLGVTDVRYRILETSADLRNRQQDLLSPLQADVKWWDALPKRPINGVVFANEVMDALPVDRFRYQDGELYWCYVESDQSTLQLTWRKHDGPENTDLRTSPDWPEGYEGEVCPTLVPWVHSLQAMVDRGVVMLVDYGELTEALYHASRSGGSIRCYARHRVHDDVLWYPGAQDITANVDFGAVVRQCQQPPWRVHSLNTQADFLLTAGFSAWFEQRFEEAEQPEKLAQEARTLLDPAQMGERFKVLTLRRNVDLPVFGAYNLADQA